MIDTLLKAQIDVISKMGLHTKHFTGYKIQILSKFTTFTLNISEYGEYLIQGKIISDCDVWYLQCT
jgi:hypothetical protein